MIMARENKILKTLKAVKTARKKDADPEFDEYLAKIDQTGRLREKNNRLKPQSISLYPDDVPVIRQLRRFIEDETDAMNVPISAIYRAALHTAISDRDKFVRVFKKLD